MERGRRHGSRLWAMLTVTGLTALVTAYAGVLALLKFLCALYLLQLSDNAFRSALKPDVKTVTPAARGGNLYLGALTIQMTNPKHALHWIAIVVIGLGGDAPLWVGGVQPPIPARQHRGMPVDHIVPVGAAPPCLRDPDNLQILAISTTSGSVPSRGTWVSASGNAVIVSVLPCLRILLRSWRMALQPDLDLIQSLEEELFKATVRNSPEAVSMLLAENFVEFGRSGKVHRKGEVVRSLAGETHQVDTPVRQASDFALTPLAKDVVLLTYRSVRKFPDGGQEQHSLRSSIWKFMDGRWQMMFHQGTPTRG